jgi:tRNA(adenine34) deaminase
MTAPGAPLDVDETHMRRCLALAAEAQALGEVPIGCVVVHEGVVVGEGFNRREVDHDPLGHAEIRAIAQAAARLGRWRLSGCTLYVTLEPCFMCAGALVNARVDRLVYGALDPKAGAVASLGAVCSDARLNHRMQITGGVLEAECGAVLKAFFQRLRDRRGGDA